MEAENKLLEEIVAFALHKAKLDKTPLTEIVNEWQTVEGVREAHRELAKRMVYELAEQGVAVKVNKPKKAEEAVEFMTTVPAHKAYELV
jgi:hypothetical protein